MCWHRWVDEKCGWELDLIASQSDPRNSLLEYTITAMTSPVRHAASKIWTKIFVELAGQNNESGPQLLLLPGGQFTPGRNDTLTVQLRDLGELKSVELWGGSHARAAAAWHVDMLVVTESSTSAR